MKSIDRLSVIRHLNEITEDWIHNELFQIFQKDDIWIGASQNIKFNKGFLTLEIKEKTINEINLDSLQKIRKLVIAEKYNFKLVKTFEVSKSYDKKNLFILLMTHNKIMQEVIKIVLEAIYEPLFMTKNLYFGQATETHDTLRSIKSKFRSIDWIIGDDVENASETIDPDQLCIILRQKIQDIKFISLIQRWLRSNILYADLQSNNLNFDILQSNTIYRIFTNIYYNDLDKWLKKKTIILTQSLNNKCVKKSKHLSHKIYKINKKLYKFDKKANNCNFFVKKLKFEKKKRLDLINKYKQIPIKYVRYTGNWIIGVRGAKNLANKLKVEIEDFLKINLNLYVQPPKTELTNIQSGKTKFLKYRIHLLKEKGIFCSIKPKTNQQIIYRSDRIVQIDLPLDSILKKIYKKGYVRKLSYDYIPISNKNYITLEDIVIIKHFQMIWRALDNYYFGCINIKKLRYIRNLFYISCGMTLAHRHKSSSKKIFKKYGKIYRIFNKEKKMGFYWSLKNRKWLIRNKFVNPLKTYIKFSIEV